MKTLQEQNNIPLEKSIFLYPTTDLMMQAEYEFARQKKSKGQKTPGLIITFNDFIKALTKPFSQNKKMLSALMSKELFLQVLIEFEQQGVLKSLRLEEAQLESTAQSLSLLNQELREQGLKEEDLLQLSQNSPYWQDIYQILQAYQELKAKNLCYDNYDLFAYIFNLPAEQELPQIFEGMRALYAHDFYFSSKQEERLFAWCQERFTFCQVDKTPPASWQDLTQAKPLVIASFDLNREVQDVLTEIKRSLLKGIKPHQWAIICRQEEPYFSLLRQELESAGLPYSLVLRRPLAAQPLIQAIKIIFEALNEPYRINLPKLLRTSILNQNSQTALEVAGLWPVSGLLGEFQTWLNRLESARQHNKPFDLSAEEEASLGRFYPDELFRQGEALIRKWQADLQIIPQKASAEEYQAALTKLLELRGLDNLPLLIKEMPLEEGEKLLLQKQYQGAYLGFLDALKQMQDLSFSQEETKIWSLKEYLLNLNEVLEENLLPLPYGQPAGIRIGTPLRLRGQEYYGVAILGLNEDAFPLLPGSNWLLNRESMYHLQQLKPNWPDNLSNMAREEELLRLSLSLGKERHILSYSQRDLKGNGLSPSPFLLLLQWNLPDLKFSQGRASPFDVDRSATLNPHWLNLTCLAQQAEKQEISIDRNIKVDARLIPPKLKQSPTSYNSYRSCPYAYLLSFGLRLQEPIGVSETLSPLDRGTLLHRILHRLSQDWAEPLYNSQEVNRDQCIEILDKTLNELWLMPDTLNLPESLWQAEKLLHRELLLKWLDEEIDLFEKTGNKPTYLEWYFGKEEELKISPDNYPVQGKIDRIDLNPQGQAVLYDYKSGSDLSYRPIRREPLKDLQLHIYALAWEALMEKEAQEAAYYFPGRGQGKANLISSFDQSSWPQLKEEAKALLSRFDNLISLGSFPIEPVDDICQHCAFNGFCPKGGDALE